MTAFIKIHYKIDPTIDEWINIDHISRIGKDYIYVNEKRYNPVESGEEIHRMTQKAQYDELPTFKTKTAPMCENCKTETATRGLGETKVLCSNCWNECIDAMISNIPIDREYE